MHPLSGSGRAEIHPEQPIRMVCFGYGDRNQRCRFAMGAPFPRESRPHKWHQARCALAHPILWNLLRLLHRVRESNRLAGSRGFSLDGGRLPTAHIAQKRERPRTIVSVFDCEPQAQQFSDLTEFGWSFTRKFFRRAAKGVSKAFEHCFFILSVLGLMIGHTHRHSNKLTLVL